VFIDFLYTKKRISIYDKTHRISCLILVKNKPRNTEIREKRELCIIFLKTKIIIAIQTRM